MQWSRAIAVVILSNGLGCAHRRAITGTIIDRNGAPVDRVLVSLQPGEVEVITDSKGGFRIDYLRDERGNRINLQKRVEYRIEAFRPGFHVAELAIYYKRGELQLEAMTMTEDTIRIQPGDANLDPAAYPDRTHSSGASYEGE